MQAAVGQAKKPKTSDTSNRAEASVPGAVNRTVGLVRQQEYQDVTLVASRAT